MKVELQGRVASVGVDREGKASSTIEIPDERYSNFAQAFTLPGMWRMGASAKVTVEVEE